MSRIRVHDLHKSFDATPILRGIEMEVDSGEFVVLLGANGCGKSTLIRCLNGLTRPDRGRIEVASQDLAQARGRRLRRARQQVGLVFQHLGLVPKVSVFQNVLYGALGQQPGGLLRTLPALAPSGLREQAMHCLERVGLAHYAASDCRHLSGGQLQRVAIARALLQDPDVLLADEPVASLDPSAGRAVMALLVEIARERGITVLCSLHQLELASEFGDRILGMKAGRIALDAPRSNVAQEAMDQLYQDQPRVEETPAEQQGIPLRTRSA